MFKFGNKRNNSGFTLLESIIAVVMGGIILTGAISLLVNTIKNGKFVEKTFDVKKVLNQKGSQLFNNTTDEVAKIGDSQFAGSINPSQPINGYYDLLNESGCIINKTKTSLGEIGGVKGDLGNGDTDDTTTTTPDCSLSATPSSSILPAFRRQWIVNKDFPNKNDISFSVIVIAIQTNQILMSTTITKSDGVSVK